MSNSQGNPDRQDFFSFGVVRLPPSRNLHSFLELFRNAFCELRETCYPVLCNIHRFYNKIGEVRHIREIVAEDLVMSESKLLRARNSCEGNMVSSET